MQLTRSDLILQRALIGGQWVAEGAGRTFAVTNPATGATLATVPDCGATEARAAVDRAQRAFPEWRALTAKDRSRLLDRWFDALLANRDDLARLIALEQGKPLREAQGEVEYGAAYVEWFAEEAKRVYGDIIPPTVRGRRVLVAKEPVGVVAAITPWNFPVAMLARKIAPALAVGCTVVAKPAEDTPLTALALAALAQEAGLPNGVLNMISASR